MTAYVAAMHNAVRCRGLHARRVKRCSHIPPTTSAKAREEDEGTEVNSAALSNTRPGRPCLRHDASEANHTSRSVPPKLSRSSFVDALHAYLDMVRSSNSCVLASLVLICAAAVNGAELEASESGWPFWGGNLNNTRFTAASALVNQTSVENLAVAFNVSLLGAVSASPFVYGSSVVMPTWAGHLYSVDSSTGIIQWQRTVEDYVASPLCDQPTQYNFTASTIRIISRTTPALVGRDLIVIGTQGELYGGFPYVMGKTRLPTSSEPFCSPTPHVMAT